MSGFSLSHVPQLSGTAELQDEMPPQTPRQRVPIGSIVFEKACDSLQKCDFAVSMYIFNLRCGVFDNVAWIVGVTVSLFWTIPGLFLPIAIMIVSHSFEMGIVAAICGVASLIQCVLVLKGIGKFMIHVIAFPIYLAVVFWAALTYTVQGGTVVCYFGVCITASLCIFAPLKWEFDRERPIVVLSRQQEAEAAQGSTEPPWENRRAPLMRDYLLHLAGRGDPYLIHQANESFPSGDSAAAAAMGTALVCMTGQPLYALYILGVMLGRVYFFCHYLMDTVVGMVIGVVPALLWQFVWGWENVTWMHLAIEVSVCLVILGPLFVRHHRVKKAAMGKMFQAPVMGENDAQVGVQCQIPTASGVTVHASQLTEYTTSGSPDKAGA